MQIEASTVGYVGAWAPLLAVSSLRGADGVEEKGGGGRWRSCARRPWRALGSSMCRGGRGKRGGRKGLLERVAPRDVFPSVFGWPERPGIMVGMDEKDSIPCALIDGTGMCKSGITGFTLRVVFLSLSSGLMLSIMAGVNQKNVGGGLGFTGDDASRAVFSSVVGGPFPMVQTVLLTMEILRLPLCTVVCVPVMQVVQVLDIPFVLQRLIPMVQTFLQFLEIPQLLYVFWSTMCLLCGSCRFSGFAVEKTFVLPQLQLAEKIVARR